MSRKTIFNAVLHRYIWYKEVIKRHNKTKIGILHRIRAIKYGFSSDFYNMYNLKSNSPDDYISEYVRVLSREIDGEYKILLDNKILFTELFSRYVKIPKIEFYIEDKIYDSERKIASFDNFITKIKGRKLIIKPINDGGGHGVHIIEENSGLYFDFKKISKNELKERIGECKDSIINEFIVQNRYASKIFPNSVNTIRLITIKDPSTGEYTIPCAAHRFGNSNTGAVDNVSSGGFVTQIDIATGVLGYSKRLNDDRAYKSHPDTCCGIYGVKIPRWKEICSDVLSVSARFPFLPFIAWDIVVTENSYAVLEANASCSLELFQLFGSIKESALWDFYKYYGYVKK